MNIERLFRWLRILLSDLLAFIIIAAMSLTLLSQAISQQAIAALSDHYPDFTEQQVVGFNPYIVAIPGSGLNNGTLLVSAGSIGEQINPVFVTADQGPTSHKYSYTMEFDGQTESYRYTLENFFDNPSSTNGTIEITTTVLISQTQAVTETLSSGKRAYERWPVFRDQSNRLDLANGALTLSIDANTLPAELAFILVLDTIAPVQAPVDQQPVSNAYSIQPSGSIGTASRPYLIILRYADEQVNGVDPEQLAIYWFNPTSETWQREGGTVHSDRKDIVLSTTRFGTFMLFAPAPQYTATPTITSTPTPTASATSTPMPTATPRTTVTLTPTMTVTPIPIATPTTTLIPTSMPTATLEDSLNYLFVPMVQN